MRVITAPDAELANLDERIDRFWAYVAQAQRGAAPAESAPDSLSGPWSSSWLDEADRRLREVHPELSCRTDAAGAALRIVTPDPALRPLLERVVRRRPAALPIGCEAGYPRLDPEHALAHVFEATHLDLSDARARIGFGRGHLLDVVIQSRAVAQSDDPDALDAADLLCESLFGEYDFEDWVGGVSVEPRTGGGLLRVLNPDAAQTVVLADLPATFAAATNGLREGLPDVPTFELARGAEWTLLEVEVEADYGPQHEFAAQDDLMLVSTVLPEMVKSYLQGAPLHSGRFTRFDETFAYLKIDGVGLSPGERLEQREQVEHELEARLAPHGGVVGTGSGVRYSYIMVSLLDLTQGPAACLASLRPLREGQDGWLLFFDTRFEREWLSHRTRLPPGF